MRETFFKELFLIAQKDRDVVLVSGDLGYGLLDRFRKELPQQFINAGISEQNMISVATGLALEGKKVYVYSIANFPSFRCLEQIRNDVAYHNANVKIISAGVGFDYGALGFSHHATEDISIIRPIPNISILSPCDPYEAKIAVKYTYKKNRPFYIRLGKNKEENFKVNRKNYNIEKPFEIIKGEKIAIFSTGTITKEAIKAATNLSKKSLNIAVYGFTMIKPLNEKEILKIIQKYDVVFTLEENRKIGGFGSAICEIIAEYNKKTRIIKIGLDDEFTYVAGSREYLLAVNNIDFKTMENIILKYKE